MQVKAAKLDKEKSEPPLRSSTMKRIQAGCAQKPLEVPGIGPSPRVALWNIERGLELDYIELFLTNKAVRTRRGSAACGWTKFLQKSKS